MKEFFSANKVLITGLVSAVALAIYELMNEGEANVKVLVFAALLGGASFLANNLRGQWASIAALVGTAIATYLTMEANGNISWAQLILQMILGFLGVTGSPAKSRAYEHTPAISQAKAQAEKVQPSVGQP